MGSHEPDPKDVNALFNRGAVLFGNKNYDKAIQYYEKALVLDPNNYTVLCYKGIALLKLQKGKEAKNCFEEMSKKLPNNVRELIGLGSFVKWCGYDQYAEVLFDKGLEIDPSDQSLVLSKIGYLEGRKKYGEAIKLIEKALEYKPTNCVLVNSKAILLKKQGNRKEAKKLHEKALDLMYKYGGATRLEL